MEKVNTLTVLGHLFKAIFFVLFLTVIPMSIFLYIEFSRLPLIISLLVSIFVVVPFMFLFIMRFLPDED